MKHQIQGLLFDKDGTLFDFTGSWGRWIRDQILDLSKGDTDIVAQMSGAVRFDMRTEQFAPDSVVIAGTPVDIVEAMLPALPHFSHQGLLQHLVETSAYATQDEAVPLQPLLSRFRSNGLKLGVATNDAEDAARAHLQSVDIETAFDFISGSDSGHGAKPEPGMMHAFCRKTGLEPAKVAMIGDSTHDLKAGAAAGMMCIAVLTGVATRGDLTPFADHILSDIGQLPDFLGLP